MTNPDPSSKPTLYIDEHVTIREGGEAEAALRAKVGAEPVDPERGVVRVSRERWEEAQRYERRTWMELARRAFSDRNEQHARGFERYAALAGRHFARGIELGCGPFTNLRLILEHCTVDAVWLLDPLLAAYLAHPFCKYRGGRLGGLLNETPARWPGYLRHPLRAARAKLNDLRVGGLRGRSVTTVASMIEAYESPQTFDLVVMINVLEHCQDANAVLARVAGLLAPGGVLVYHDKSYDAGEVARLQTVLYDAGHPLRVDRTVVDAFLAEHFEPRMRAEAPVESEFRGVRMRYADLYFIGEKRAG